MVLRIYQNEQKSPLYSNTYLRNANKMRLKALKNLQVLHYKNPELAERFGFEIELDWT